MPGLQIRAFLKNPGKGLDSIRAEYGPILSNRPFYAIFKRPVYSVPGNCLGLNGVGQENMPSECSYVAAKGTIISPN
jgi:hypothetical protein